VLVDLRLSLEKKNTDGKSQRSQNSHPPVLACKGNKDVCAREWGNRGKKFG
jgi:hypothetical protein